MEHNKKMLVATLVGLGFHLKFREVFCIWDVQNLANNGINYLSAGEGLEPSTVGLSAETKPMSPEKLDDWTSLPFLLKWPPGYGTC